MTDDADLDLVRRTFAAFARGDLAELTQCFAPDVEQFVPGKHALAGGSAAWTTWLRASATPRPPPTAP